MEILPFRRWVGQAVAAATARTSYPLGKITDSNPTPPYTVIYGIPSDGWDRGPLQARAKAGWVRFQITAVGRTEEDSLWLLDQIRPVLDGASGSGSGWTANPVESRGSPSEPQEAGTLVSVVEQYAAYVQEATP